MQRSLRSVLVGTFTLRFSTGLTGALLVYYLAKLPEHGGQTISAFELGLLAAAFFVAELILSPIFGVLSDRFGHHRLMQLGPIFGFVAVILTGLTTDLWILGSSDAGGEIDDCRAGADVGIECDLGHLDRLFVVSDHSLCEFDIGGVQGGGAR